MEFIDEKFEKDYSGAVSLIVQIAWHEYFQKINEWEIYLSLTPEGLRDNFKYTWLQKLMEEIVTTINMAGSWASCIVTRKIKEPNCSSDWLSLFLMQNFATDDRLRHYKEVETTKWDDVNKKTVEIHTPDFSKEYSYDFCCMGLQNAIEVLGMPYLKPMVELMTNIFLWDNLYYKKEREKTERVNIKQSPKSIPTELRSPKAMGIFKKAIIAKLIEEEDSGYKWCGGAKNLLAYFAERMSGYLTLSTKYTSGGDYTVNWNVFELSFGVKDLKSAKYNWMNSGANTVFSPNGHTKIDDLFKL